MLQIMRYALNYSGTRIKIKIKITQFPNHHREKAENLACRNRSWYILYHEWMKA